MNQEKLYVVEWNEKTKDVHIQTVESMQRTNFRNAKRGVDAGYVPLFANLTSEEANRIAIELQSGILVNTCDKNGISI